MNILKMCRERPYHRDASRLLFWDALISASPQFSDFANWLINQNTNKANAANVAATNEAQIQIARENNALQERMNKYNNQFAAEQAEIQRNWDSAQQQMARLRASGINPAVAFGQGAANAGSASLATPHGSGISPSMPALTPAHVEGFQFADTSASMRNFAQAFEALASSEKTKNEAEVVKKTMASKAQQEFEKAQAMRYENVLNAMYSSQERSLALAHVKAETANLSAQFNVLCEEGQIQQAKKVRERIGVVNDRYVASLNGDKARSARIEADNLQRMLDQQYEESRSRAASNYASAQHQTSQALLNDEQRSQLEAMRDYNIRQKAALTQMDEAELRKTAATLDSQIDYMLGHFDMLNESDRIELEKIRSELKIQKNIQNTWWFTYVFDKIERINNGLTNWIPFAPDKESSSRSEVYTDDGRGMRSRTVVHDTFRGKSFK